MINPNKQEQSCLWKLNLFLVYLQYEKLVMTDDLKIKKIELTTESRKSSLIEIRNAMLKT